MKSTLETGSQSEIIVLGTRNVTEDSGQTDGHTHGISMVLFVMTDITIEINRIGVTAWTHRKRIVHLVAEGRGDSLWVLY